MTMDEQIETMWPIWGATLDAAGPTGGARCRGDRGPWSQEPRPAGSRAWRPRRALDVSMRAKEKEMVQKSLSGFASHHLEGSTLPSTSPVESIPSLLLPLLPSTTTDNDHGDPTGEGVHFPLTPDTAILSARSETSCSWA